MSSEGKSKNPFLFFSGDRATGLRDSLRHGEPELVIH
jgi:hypothetical protein